MNLNHYVMEDALEYLIDYRGKTPQKSDTGIPTLSAKSVKNGYIDYSECYYISPEEYKRFMVRGFPKVGDVLLTTEAPMGMTARLDRDDVGIAQRLITLRGKEGILDNNYLLYYLQSPIGQHKLAERETGSTVTGIKQAEFRKIEIDIPNIDVQRKIAACLTCIDKKTENNKQINRNLSEQAQTLFKSWFIDLEPFNGEVPENWSTGVLKDILQLKKDGIKAGERPELPYLPIDVIPMNDFSIKEVKPNEEAQSSLITFDKDDILIGAMRVYFHRVVIAPFDGITRSTCFVLRPYDDAFLSFGLLCCNQNSSIDYAQATSKGSTMPYAVWDNGLGDMVITIPDRKTAKEFNDLIKPMLANIQQSFYEINRLKELRDSLLPKLMSGELDVSDLDI